MSQQKHIYRGLTLKLDSSSIEVVSIKNYEIRISKYNYMHIQVYLCRGSLLTTLDIYKDYYKGSLSVAKGFVVSLHLYCNQRQKLP